MEAISKSPGLYLFAWRWAYVTDEKMYLCLQSLDMSPTDHKHHSNL
jgi:hypothetical protein